MQRGLVFLLLAAALALAPGPGAAQEAPEVSTEDIRQHFKEEVLGKLQAEVEQESWVLDPQFREPTNRDKEEYLRAVADLLFHAAVYRAYLVEDKDFPADPHTLADEGIIDQWPTNPYTKQPIRLSGWSWFAPGDLFWAYSDVPCKGERYCGKKGIWLAATGRERNSLNYWSGQFPGEKFKFDSRPIPFYDPGDIPGYYIYLADSTGKTLYRDARYFEIRAEVLKQRWRDYLANSAEFPDSEAREQADSVTAEELEGTEVSWTYSTGGGQVAEGSVTLAEKAFQQITVNAGGRTLRFYALSYPVPDQLQPSFRLLEHPNQPHYQSLFRERNLLIIAESSAGDETWEFTVGDKTLTETETYIPRTRMFYRWSRDMGSDIVRSGELSLSPEGYYHRPLDPGLLYLPPGIELAEVPAKIRSRGWSELTGVDWAGKVLHEHSDKDVEWDVGIEVITGESAGQQSDRESGSDG